MNKINEDIKEVQEIIDFSVKNRYTPLNKKPFTKYSRTYYATNENIKGYLNLAPIYQYHNALCVLASGDQLFNLICGGIKNITTFDINVISSYFVFGLKEALIMKYNYQDYLKINKILVNEDSSLELITNIINDLLPDMEYPYRIFWQIILDYNYKLQKNTSHPLNLILLLTQNAQGFKMSIRGNNYLIREEEYNKLKNNLTKTNISFLNTDLNNINISEKYDLVLLSNIISYYEREYNVKLNYDNINSLINKITSITNQNGTIFFNYLFENEVFKLDNYYNYLTKMQLEYHEVCALSYLYDVDGVILKRVK